MTFDMLRPSLNPQFPFSHHLVWVSFAATFLCVGVTGHPLCVIVETRIGSLWVTKLSLKKFNTATLLWLNSNSKSLVKLKETPHYLIQNQWIVGGVEV